MGNDNVTNEQKGEAMEGANANASNFYAYMNEEAKVKSREPGVCGPEFPNEQGNGAGGKGTGDEGIENISPAMPYGLSCNADAPQGERTVAPSLEGAYSPMDDDREAEAKAKAEAEDDELERLRMKCEAATEDGLRGILADIEGMSDEKTRKKALRVFDKECDKRATSFYENMNNGEWL